MDMNIQLENFTVRMTDGQTCEIREICEKGGVTVRKQGTYRKNI